MGDNIVIHWHDKSTGTGDIDRKEMEGGGGGGGARSDPAFLIGGGGGGKIKRAP